MCCHIYILILISLFSHTFADIEFDIEFVTEPPEKVKTFQGQNVTLPCVLKNLIPNYHVVQWAQIESYELHNISNNKNVLIPHIENFGHFSILGGDMNFTLLIKIAEPKFKNNNIVKYKVRCFVIDPYVNRVALSSTSEISITKRPEFIKPICGKMKTYYVIGETLTLRCYEDPDPTIITTLKSGNSEVLPTKFNGSHIIHNLTITKNDHGAIFKFESRKNGTNERKSCSIGPITVNYKPEIYITQISAKEFYCIAEARPHVDKMNWIVESSIPEGSFMISKNVLKFNESSEVGSEMKITCEAENTIGKGNKTLSISVVNNRDEEDGSSIIPTVNSRDEKYGSNIIIPTVNNRDEEDGSSIIPTANSRDEKYGSNIIPTVNNKDEEDGSSIIPTVNSRDEVGGSRIIPILNNQDEDDGSDSTSVIIVCVLFFIVAVFVLGSLCLYKYHRNKLVTTLCDDTIVDQTNKEEDGYQIPLKRVHEHYESLKVAESMNTKEDEKFVGYDDIDLPIEDGQSVEVTSSSTTTKPLTTLYDDTIVDQTNKEEDGYQIPLKSVCEHYQSLNIRESRNSKEDEKFVGYDDIYLPNEKGQSLEVTSGNTTYINTLDNKNRCRINKIKSNPTSNAQGEQITYVNNPRVKKCQFPGKVHPTNIGNEEYDDKKTDTDYETVSNLVIPDNANNKSSHHSETTADVNYINFS